MTISNEARAQEPTATQLVAFGLIHSLTVPLDGSRRATESLARLYWFVRLATLTCQGFAMREEPFNFEVEDAGVTDEWSELTSPETAAGGELRGKLLNSVNVAFRIEADCIDLYEALRRGGLLEHKLEEAWPRASDGLLVRTSWRSPSDDSELENG